MSSARTAPPSELLTARGGALSPAGAVAITAQVLDGLDHVHVRRGLVHRDVKPSNILVTAVGASGAPT